MTSGRGPRFGVGRRLAPLQLAIALQGLLFWVAIEKVFMTSIGFTAATIGLMAAAYAAVVPLLEVPSGILADRSSRKAALVIATAAVFLSTLIGGLSVNVTMYIVSAMVLGVYFAVNSGTIDSVVYDVVVEETGTSDLYEKWIGRVRLAESVALVLSALVGGLIGQLVSLQAAYFLSLPLIAVAAFAFTRFREPTLHRQVERVTLRAHIAVLGRAIRRRAILKVILLTALAATLTQVMFEFGPLWLVALHAPPALFGPYWAGLVAMFGLAGYLASKVRLDHPATAVIMAGTTTAASVGLVLSDALVVVIMAQILIVLVLALIAIHAGRLLHDAVPSNIRAGVSSGAATLSWVLFLPVSLALGSLASQFGVSVAGGVVVAIAVTVGVILVVSTREGSPSAITRSTVPDHQPV